MNECFLKVRRDMFLTTRSNTLKFSFRCVCVGYDTSKSTQNMIFASLLSFWCMLILSLPIRMMIRKFMLAAKDIKGERKKDKRRYFG